MKSYMMSQSWKASDSTKNRKKQREKNFTCSEALHISVRRSTNFADAQYRLLQHRNHALRVLGGATDCADLISDGLSMLEHSNAIAFFET